MTGRALARRGTMQAQPPSGGGGAGAAYDALILSEAALQSYWPLISDGVDHGPAAHNLTVVSGSFGSHGAPDGRNLFDATAAGQLKGGQIYAFPNGGFTIELLFAKTGDTAATPAIVSRYGPGDNGWALWDVSGDLAPWRFGDTAADAWNSGVVTPASLTLIAWTHDGTSSRVYENGVLAAGPHTSSGSSPATPGNDFCIGLNPSYGLVYGYYGRCAVYNAALSAAALASHASALGL